jgi:hypothetical protein
MLAARGTFQVARLEEAKTRADTQWRTQLITFEAEVKKRQSQTQAELAQLRAKVTEVRCTFHQEQFCQAQRWGSS